MRHSGMSAFFSQVLDLRLFLFGRMVMDEGVKQDEGNKGVALPSVVSVAFTSTSL